MNFVICGLPRSGTTIIARFVGALPGVYVAHEPMQTYAQFKSLPPWLCAAEHLGIKEAYWSERGKFVNDAALNFLRHIGWKFVWIERDGIREALARRGIPQDQVNRMLPSFADFKGHEPAIKYEEFCADPVGTWNKHNPIGVLATEVRFAPCPEPFMGDWRAFKSTTVERLH